MSGKSDAALLKTLGSLWFAAVLLVLLLLSMACATIYESSYGSERALMVFYKSWWFKSLLTLLGLNVLAAMLVRWPFNRRQAGFVVTHLSIIAILIGAQVTQSVGVQGRLAVTEGQGVKEFLRDDSPTLTVVSQKDQGVASIDLPTKIFAGFEPITLPNLRPLTLGNLQVSVTKYLPDSTESEQIIDDPALGQPAIEFSLSDPSKPEHTQSDWAFGGSTTTLGAVPIAFTIARTPEDLNRLLTDVPVDESASKGSVRIQYQGQEFSIPLEQCQEAAVPVGETAYSVKVLRYLPHAIVGAEHTIVSASSQPVNPYIEAELTGPNGTETRRAFAKMPDWESMHSSDKARDLKLTFIAAPTTVPTVPIEVIAGPDGVLHVRFSQEGKILAAKQLQLDAPVDTPWPPWQFSVLQSKPKARWEQMVIAHEQVRKTGRQKALLLQLTAGQESKEQWVSEDHPVLARIGGMSYEIGFGEKQVPLGFVLTLDKFRMGKYPGSQQPRSYESHITINDPHAGGEISRVISMNNPTEYGGYTFYQSSFNRGENNKNISVLSVSRDPGQPVVFAGYFGVMIGMVWVLANRMKERRVMPPECT